MEQEIQELREDMEKMQRQVQELSRVIEMMQTSATKGSFTNRQVFNTPVQAVAGISPQVGGIIALYIGSGNFGIYYGSGLPTITASKGSLYLRSDGSSTSTRLYVNTDGGTTWTNFTSTA